MVAQVLRVRLGNHGNHCYCNALLKCLWVAAARSPCPPDLLIHHQLFRLMSGFFRASGIPHVWGNPFWRTLLRGWQAPDAQHDVAEFLQFMAQQCQGLADMAGASWVARMEVPERLVQSDSGFSCPLGLLPPSCDCVSVAQLVQSWHLQDHAHALLYAPPVLVFQAGRFSYDGTLTGRTNCSIAFSRIRNFSFLSSPEVCQCDKSDIA